VLMSGLKNLFQGLSQRSSRVVGVDKAGNTYHEVFSNTGLRRQVQYKEKHYDPNSVPILWWSWLNHSTDIPPTTEDLERHEIEQEILKYNIKKVEEREAKSKKNNLNNTTESMVLKMMQNTAQSVQKSNEKNQQQIPSPEQSPKISTKKPEPESSKQQNSKSQSNNHFNIDDL